MASAAEAEWSDRVARWKSSGLSTREFAATEGVNASSLAWWRWKLAKRAHRPKETRRKTSRAEVRPLAFVQVRAATVSPVEVVLATGHVIRVPRDADVELVVRLAAAFAGGTR